MNEGDKHVAVRQLNIVKDYIDDKTETLLNALVESDSGVHGLRYKDGVLQHQNPDGTWSDITTANSGGSSGGGDSGGLDSENIATDEDVKAIFGM